MVTSILAAGHTFSACSVPEREFLKDQGGLGGAGERQGDDPTGDGDGDVTGTTDDGAGGSTDSTGGPDGSGGYRQEHKPGTPLSPAAPDALLEPILWNAPVEFGLFLEHAADDVSWSLLDGQLPAGLNLEDDGTLAGRALEWGEFTVTVQAESAAGDRGELPLTMVVQSRSYVAYVMVDNDSGTERLILSNLALDPPTRIDIESAPEVGRIGSMSFSPDGNSFAYLIDEDGNPDDCVVKLVHLEPGAPVAKTVGSAKAACNEPFRWSPDGSAFVHLRLSEGNQKAPALVRARNDEDSYFIYTNQGANTATSIDWVTDELVLYNQAAGNPDLAIDVSESSMTNARALSAATNTLAISSSEGRFYGEAPGGFELIDVDGDETVNFSETDRSVSPHLLYSLLDDADGLLVHDVLSLKDVTPEPVVTIERDFEEDQISFSGSRDRYLTGYFDNQSEGTGLWEYDLENPSAPRGISAPTECVPQPFGERGWWRCFASINGTVQSYLYRPGLDDAFHESLNLGDAIDISPELIVSPDGSSVLQLVTNTASGTIGVHHFSFPELEATAPRKLVSPQNDPSATQAQVIEGIRPVWTADGVFAVFVMDRPIESSVASMAVWAFKTIDEGAPLNVSATNNACQADANAWAGNDCLRISRLIAQPEF